jgi:hypothetical protein
MSITDPSSWLSLPEEAEDHVRDCFEDSFKNRFVLVETDDGWAIEARVRISSGAISHRYLLPESDQVTLIEALDEVTEMLVWERQDV